MFLARAGRSWALAAVPGASYSMRPISSACDDGSNKARSERNRQALQHGVGLIPLSSFLLEDSAHTPLGARTRTVPAARGAVWLATSSCRATVTDTCGHSPRTLTQPAHVCPLSPGSIVRGPTC